MKFSHKIECCMALLPRRAAFCSTRASRYFLMDPRGKPYVRVYCWSCAEVALETLGRTLGIKLGTGIQELSSAEELTAALIMTS